MNKCLFCNISEFPEEQKIEVNALFSVLLDLNPQTKGHLLVVPKAHFSKLQDIPSELMALLFSKSIEYGGILQSKLGAKAYVIKVNNELYKLEKEGHIGHIHLHVIPRYNPNEKVEDNPRVASSNELLKVRERITKNGI